jgi:hypothetical protein
MLLPRSIIPTLLRSTEVDQAGAATFIAMGVGGVDSLPVVRCSI